MAIDRFTKQRFEDALPRHKDNGTALWEPLGMLNNEECYTIQVNDKIRICVRSSVRPDGLAAETGADSIRIWIIDHNGSPMGSKISAYVTRVRGWELRMKAQLKELYKMALKVSKPCHKCGGTDRLIFISRTPQNSGRQFVKCSCGDFEWLSQGVQNMHSA